MNHTRYNKKIDRLVSVIKKKDSEIDRLTSIIHRLENEISELQKSEDEIEFLKTSLNEQITIAKSKKKECEDLICEMRDMKKTMYNLAFNNHWRLAKWLFK